MAVATYGDVINETSCPTTHLTISSFHRKDWSVQVSAVIIKKITGNQPRQDASIVREMPWLQGLSPADPHFDSPGRIDLLLGADVLPDIMTLDGPRHSVKAVETIFGYAFMGTYQADHSTEPKKATVQLAKEKPMPTPEEHVHNALVKFWEVEEPTRQITLLTPDEKRVQQHYEMTHVFLPSIGKYQVVIPKNDKDLTLGDSRSRTLQRFHSNERALHRKGSWEKFQSVIQEYLDLNHAQPVTEQELQTPEKDCYYFPMHGVYKDSSSTTKLRVVFDASAQSSTKVSLNDTLAVGPMLHPTLDRILVKFRTYKVALSGDIGKMYREILLSPSDRQFHRFLWRPKLDQPVREFCMNRVTFGVASSPYLAVRTLQQTASDFGQDFPVAKWHVNHSFYVDDLLGGSDSIEVSLKLFSELTEMLSKGGFTLKKFRSSSVEVLSEIPEELIEPMPSQDLVDLHSTSYPKALGVAWNSKEDTMSTDVQLPVDFKSTKRGIIADVARTFDVLGWIAPVILPMKVLFQQLWELKLGWDDEVPAPLKLSHERWRKELPLLADIELPRC